MSPCLSNADFIAFDEGKLDPSSQAKVREHLKSCESCSHLYEGFRKQAAYTIAVPPSNPRLTIPPPAAAAPAHPQDDEAARHYPKIEGYRILGVLGQGGMGIVYRAVQTKLNRTVALKVLPAMMGAANPSAVSRFRREATAAARLHHTNIIPIHDFGESRDAYYYAMDLIVGQPLNSLIRRLANQNAASASPTRLAEMLRDGSREISPIDLEELATRSSVDESSTNIGSGSTGRGRAYYQQVARWMADAADALHYAHGQGIIHRDVKPANLILSFDGRIMVADFGLAKTVDEESVTMTGALLGSLRYVSPEQAMAKRVRVDHRTDIYSLGATLYELLCFQPAFPGTDEKAILGAIIARDPTTPRKIAPTVPSELDTICMKSLEKSPESRYATARALGEDLRRYIQDLPITAKRPGITKRVTKFVKRRKAPVIAVTAAVLLFAMGAWLRWERTTGLAARVAKFCESGHNFAQLKRWDEAEKDFRQALRLNPHDVPTLLEFARTKLEYYKAESAKAGESALIAAELAARSVVDQHPSDAEQLGKALAFQSVALRRLKRYPEAVQASEECVKVAPELYHNWSNLGVSYALNKDLENAERCLQEGAKRAGMERDEWHAAVWRNLASFELFLRKSEAADHIKNALELHQQDALASVIQARVRLELNGQIDVRKALDDAKYADRLALSRDPKAKRILALAHLRNNEFDDAVTEARAAIALNDMPAVNLLITAVAEAKRGQITAANEALQTAETAWPEQLRKPGEFAAYADTGELWIESADDLIKLREEARTAIGAPPASKP